MLTVHFVLYTLRHYTITMDFIHFCGKNKKTFVVIGKRAFSSVDKFVVFNFLKLLLFKNDIAYSRDRTCTATAPSYVNPVTLPTELAGTTLKKWRGLQFHISLEF